MTSWKDLHERLWTIFRKREKKDPAQQIADEIPVDRSHIYRLVSGKIKRPSRAVRAGVERFVKEQEKQSHDHRNQPR